MSLKTMTYGLIQRHWGGGCLLINDITNVTAVLPITSLRAAYFQIVFLNKTNHYRSIFNCKTPAPIITNTLPRVRLNHLVRLPFANHRLAFEANNP